MSGIIKKDDIHPRKYGISSYGKNKDDRKIYFYKKNYNNSQYFYRNLYRRFHILLSNEKKQET